MRQRHWARLALLLGCLGSSAAHAQPEKVATPWRMPSGLMLSLALGDAAATGSDPGSQGGAAVPRRARRTGVAAQPLPNGAVPPWRLASGLVLAPVLNGLPPSTISSDELLRNARNWLARGRLDLARQNVEKMLLAAPDAPQALAELGNIALQEGKTQEAEEILERLRQRHPHARATRDLATLVRVHGPDREQLASMRLLARAGRQKEAAEIARRLFPDGPPLVGTYGPEYYRIVAGAEGGTRNDASVRRAVDALYKDQGDADYRLIALEMRQAQAEAPLPLARELEQLAQEGGADQYRLRDLWRRVLERLEPSVQTQQRLQAYLDRYPDDATVAEWLHNARDPALMALAAAQRAMDADRTAQAEALVLKALRLRPNHPDGLGLLGWIRMRQSRYAEAQQLLAAAAQGSDAQKWRDLRTTARLWGLLQQSDRAREAGDLDRAAELARQALQQQPNNAEALVALGQIRAEQGAEDVAQKLYRQVLALEPGHAGALRRLVALLVRAGQFEAAMAVLDVPGNALRDNLAQRNELRATVLAGQAEVMLAQGKLGSALRFLEDAVSLAPADAWMRHRLARIYLQLGQSREALLAMDEGAAHDANAPEMRFARALIRSATEDYAGAVEDLEHISTADRTPAMRSLLQFSTVYGLVAQARDAHDQQPLQRAEQEAGDDPDLLWAVANAWFTQGMPEQGVAVFDRLLQRSAAAELPLLVRLEHASLLSRAQMDARLAELLPSLQSQPGWDNAQALRLARLTIEHRERVTEELMASGQQAQAMQQARAPLWGQEHLPAGEAGFARGRLLLAAQDWSGAEQALAQALQVQPDNAQLRLALGNAYAYQGRRHEAYGQALWLGAHLPRDDSTQQLALLRLLQRIPALHAANALAEELLQAFPGDTQVLLHAARLERAQDRYAQALKHFQAARDLESNTPQTNEEITQNIAAIEARRQAWVEAGVVRLSKSSTEGISSVHGYEMPTVAWMPKGYDGHHFLHVDRVQLSAGALPQAQDDALGYGQVAAWPASAYPANPGTPRGHGTNVGFGYRGTGLEWDIGATGIGMPVTNIVGGLSYGQWREDFNYRVELARRPITGSVLSYAGARDPITGQTWGGVVATSIGGRIGKPFGPYSTSLSASYALLQGKNVQNNTRLQLRAAIDRDVWQDGRSNVNVGLALSVWHYGKDLSEYSWGHGGYYSPKNYVSLSLPVEWGGRRGKFSWLARGALSFSQSSSDASSYYPGNPALQEQASAQGRVPLYGTSRSTGFGRSLRAVVEYQATPNLALGAQLALDRSAYYAPTSTLFYVRWLIDPVRAPLANRPRPVQPYSEF